MYERSNGFSGKISKGSPESGAPGLLAGGGWGEIRIENRGSGLVAHKRTTRASGEF